MTSLFADRQRIVVGRSAECRYLFYRTLLFSRVHAEIEKTDSGLLLRDLNSVNGVMLNGEPIKDGVLLRDHDRVGVGRFMFYRDGDNFFVLDNSQSMRLQARNLEKYIRDTNRQPRKILDNISLVVEPGEFRFAVRAKWLWQKYLMDCLNGRRPATGGHVLANGENFLRALQQLSPIVGLCSAARYCTCAIECLSRALLHRQATSATRCQSEGDRNAPDASDGSKWN